MDPLASQTLRIVGGLTGEELLSLDADRVRTVRELQQAIREALAIPPREQHLLAGARPLKERELLADVLEGCEPVVTLVRHLMTKEEALRRVAEDGRKLQTLPASLRADHDVCLAAVRQCGLALRWVAPELQGDGGLVLEAVADTRGQALQFASAELRGDPDFMISAGRGHFGALYFASKELRGDFAFVIEALQLPNASLKFAAEPLRQEERVVLAALRLHGGRAMEFAAPRLRESREFVLKAVKEDGSALKHASKKLQREAEVVLAAMRSAGHLAVSFAAQTLRGDRAFMLEALQENGLALQFAGPRLRSDRDVVLVAVQQNGTALQFAAKALQRDGGLAAKAVCKDGDALEYAAEELRGSRDFVLAAVEAHGRALEFASDELREDRELVLAAVRQDGFALQFASKQLRGDRAVVLEAVANKGERVLQFAANDLKLNRDFVSAVVQKRGCSLRFLAQRFRVNRNVVLEAVRQDGLALEFASEDLQRNPQIVLEAVLQAGAKPLRFASKELGRNHSLVRAAVERDGLALEFADEALRADAELVALACERVGVRALGFAAEELWHDRPFVLSALQRNGLALQLASEELRSDAELVRVAVQSAGSQALQFATDVLLGSNASQLIGLATLPVHAATLKRLQEEVEQMKAARRAVAEPRGEEEIALMFTWKRAQLVLPRYASVAIAFASGDWTAREMPWSGARRSFTYRFQLDSSGACEHFQVLLNGDWKLSLYPDREEANPHKEHWLCGPDEQGKGLHWTVGQHPSDKAAPHARYEVRLVMAEDGSANRVEWSRLDTSMSGATASEVEAAPLVDEELSEEERQRRRDLEADAADGRAEEEKQRGIGDLGKVEKLKRRSEIWSQWEQK